MTDWDSYRSYQCEECSEYCINKLGKPWTENNLCRACNIPALEDAEPHNTSSGEEAQLVDGEACEPSISAERQSAETARAAGSGGLPPTRKPERTPPSEATGALVTESFHLDNLAPERGEN
jgi:hypothetical protein